jgi:hypothetical protein
MSEFFFGPAAILLKNLLQHSSKKNAFFKGTPILLLKVTNKSENVPLFSKSYEVKKSQYSSIL